MKYIAIDGDDIGPALRKHLVAGDAKGAAKLSADLKAYFARVAHTMIGKGCRLIFMGGDSVLFSTNAPIDVDWEEIYADGPCTISVGIGASTEVAYLALQLAKAKGKNRVVSINSVNERTLFNGKSSEAREQRQDKLAE